MDTDSEDEDDEEMARKDPLVLGLLALALVIAIVALVLGSVAFVRTSDAEVMKPSMTVSLEGACASAAPPAATPAPVVSAVVDDAAEHGGDAQHDGGAAPHWGYAGAEGPGNWGSLHADWAVCATGTKQSPVNINVATANSAGDVNQETRKITPALFTDVSKLLPANSYSGKAVSKHNGHTVGCSGVQGFFEHQGESWKLLQFHFHTPSEHTYNGNLYAAEVHFVHQSFESGNYLVVGVFIDADETKQVATAFDNILNEFPVEPKEGAKPLSFDYAEALTQILGGEPTGAEAGNATVTVPYFTYPGSFTTPPCTEAVTWVVLENPITFMNAHVDKLKNAMGANNRPTLELYDRSCLALALALAARQLAPLLSFIPLLLPRPLLLCRSYSA